MNKIILFVLILLHNAYASDCYTDIYYDKSKDIKNILIKNDCNKINRFLNFDFSLGYIIYAGKSPFQIPEIFNTFNPASFKKQILNKLNVLKGRYQPIAVYDKNNLYKSVLAIELDKKIYKYELKENELNITPLSYSYSDEEKHYPVYIHNNKLNFIAINRNSKPIHEIKQCGKYDTYILTLNLPLEEGKISYKHLGYLYHPCKLAGFKNLINFTNNELIEFTNKILDNTKYKK